MCWYPPHASAPRPALADKSWTNTCTHSSPSPGEYLGARRSRYAVICASTREFPAAVESQPARQKLIEYYDSTKTIPSSLSVAGVDETLPDGVGLSLDPSGMILTVKSKRGALVVTPMRD